ncbi:unnamed protein product [Camellia sinensis]
MTDVTKFITGCMASLSAMVQLELPHVNILSKMDLVTNKSDIEAYLNLESDVLMSELNQRMAPQFEKLNKALIELNNYSAPHVPQNVNACPTLFVANLGPTCSEQELIQVFSSCHGFIKLKMQSTYGTPVAFVDFQILCYCH